jgi:hypothetical protein
MSSNTTLFRIKTNEAYYMKVLMELLSNNLKTGCFEINNEGVFLRQMDSQRKTLIDLDLQCDNFQIFKIKSQLESEYIGINLNYLYSMLKSIKKKDSLEMSIRSDDPTYFAIETIPKENGRRTISSIKIQKTQNLDIALPEDYGRPIIVQSSEFQKTMKDMVNIGNTIKVDAQGYRIKFSSDADDIMKRVVEFGEDTGEEEDDDITYSQTFSADQFSRIAKISGLGSTIHIFPGHPLLIRSNVGNIGKISIYIKSLEELEEEKEAQDEEEEKEDDDDE